MSRKRLLASQALKGGIIVTMSVNVLLGEEDDMHCAFPPSLDITGYGKSESVAERSFEVMLDDLLDYTHTKGTIFKELERLGWTVNRKKKRVKAPDRHDLVEGNPDYREIVGRPGVRHMQREVALAL